MSFFKRLLGRSDDEPTQRWAPPDPPPMTPTRPPATTADPRRPTWMVNGVQATVYGGSETLEVVGESYRQDNLWSIVGCAPTSNRVQHDCYAILVAEDENPHDPNAISVWIDGFMIGYLSREDAIDYRPGLLRLAEQGPVALKGSVVGGGYDDRALLGVFLDHDPADFGLGPAPPSAPRELRTGLSEAFATDKGDDDYDLSWFNELPEDTRRGVVKLRTLLEHDPDPIDRHFMFSELEARLYRLRDVESGALDDYDAACAAHDGEMAVLGPALREKLGAMPLLETYKQQAIRQQKAKNWERGLWWAERGIALYATHASSQDWVDDLQKREAHFRAKLEPASGATGDRSRASTAVAPDETFTCSTCGSSWVRPRTRGRKPNLCPQCRGA